MLDLSLSFYKTRSKNKRIPVLVSIIIKSESSYKPSTGNNIGVSLFIHVFQQEHLVTSFLLKMMSLRIRALDLS